MSPELRLRAFLGACRRRIALAATFDGLAFGTVFGFASVLIAWLGASRLPVTITIAAASAIVGTAIGVWRAATQSRTVTASIERRLPESRNVVLTAAELLDSGSKSSPAIVDIVIGHAARVAASREPRALFPIAAAATRAFVGLALVVIAVVVQARWPAESSRLFAGASNAIDELSITIVPPSYAHLPETTLTNPAEVQALAGSELRVRVRSRAEQVSVETLDARSSAHLEPDGTFTARLIADRDGLIVFAASNAAGAGPRRLVGLVVQPDRPPVVRVTKPGRDIFVAAAELLPLEIVAEDDLGLASLTVAYTTVTGEGENFEFHHGDVPLSIQRANVGHWSASGALNVPALHLSPGDTVAYRAIATDARPGSSPTESDTFVVHIVSPDRSVLGGFAIDDEMNKYALSQQMIIMKTERLIAQRASMTSAAFADEAANIATEQRRLRAQFMFMMGGELEDAAALVGQLDETNEAAREEEIAAGRLRNRAYVDVVQATRHMSRAASALIVPDATGGLTEEKSALASLQQAFAKDRYLLRSLSTQERLDESRRLSGKLDEAVSGIRPQTAPEPNARTVALRRVLASIASASSSRSTSASATALADAVIRIDPSSASLRSIARELSSGGDLEKASLAIAAEIRAAVPVAPSGSGASARLSGALVDALRGKGPR